MKVTPLLISLVVITGCAVDTETPEPRSTATWMTEHTEDYLHDASWRRARLEEALWRPELPYARKRLGSYALERGGWDLLPAMVSRVEPVYTSDSEGTAVELLPGIRPQTEAEWLALGERVFWEMPMRRDAYVEWLLEQPELWDDVGLEITEEGRVLGLARFVDARGEARVGVTCGMCHGGGGVAGKANRALDLGRARAAFMTSLGREPGAYASWGPGLVDVTDDGVDDPLAIQDLFGTRHLSHLNASGSVKMVDPGSLAVRLETQFIVGHDMEVRPPRALIWALTWYVLSLEAPAAHTPETEGRGADVFAERCASCHDPQQGYAGGLIPAADLITDPASAHSPLRGTGFYKVPSLIGVSDGGPYLHDGSEPTLESLFATGHPHGELLEDEERRDLIAFLKSL